MIARKDESGTGGDTSENIKERKRRVSRWRKRTEGREREAGGQGREIDQGFVGRAIKKLEKNKVKNETTIFDSITTLRREEHPVRKIVNPKRERSNRKEEEEEAEKEEEGEETPDRELFPTLILASPLRLGSHFL